MSDESFDERRFSDREVREILKRAVQDTPGHQVSRRSGHSLAELKAIAVEAGIDPQRLEKAARSVALEKRNRSGGLLGTPRVLSLERTVEGTFDPADTPQMLAAIRRRMSGKGEVQEIHGSLEWGVSGESSERHITVTPREGRTTIAATSNLTNAAIITYIPGGIIGTIGVFVLVAALEEIGLGVLGLFLIPVLFMVLRLIMKNIGGREAEKLEGVVDDLARFVETDQDAPA